MAAAGLPPSIIFTGQHATLRAEDHGLEAFASIHLGCSGQRDPHRHVRAVTAAMLAKFAPRPDLVIVQGDTSTALGGALAAFTAGVPVAHVEAGLRTHDPQLPWPEEEYRVAIDAKAHLLFAPTAGSAANLRAEGVPGSIHETGNIGIDALLAAERRLPPLGLCERTKPRLLVTCHRRESWGEGLQSIAAAVVALTSDGGCDAQFILHPNPAVRARMEALLRDRSGIELLEPCAHLELLRLLRDADLVLSDSGGIQEEAPALGVPLLVLRDKTERPEGVASGNCRLVGTSTERIVGEARTLLRDPLVRAAMSRRALPYGDGRAAPRIAAIIREWLTAGSPAQAYVGALIEKMNAAKRW